MVDAVTMGSRAMRFLRMYPEFVFGTGSEVGGKVARNVVKNRKVAGLTYWQALQRGTKAGLKAAEDHNKNMITARGGFWKNFKHNFKTIPKKVAQGWRVGGKLAERAGKNVFWGNIKGAFKGIGKRMPLIGALMMIGFEIPNIVKATYNEGALTGAFETAKAGARLAGGALGATIGSAICPGIGSLAGWIIGEWLTSKVVGKTYSEKKDEEDTKLKTALGQTGQNPAANTDPAAAAAMAAASGITNPFIPTGLDKDTLAKMQNDLYGANGYNDDFMYNMSGMNKLNTVA